MKNKILEHNKKGVSRNQVPSRSHHKCEGVYKFVNGEIKTITENGDYHDDILQRFEDEFSDFVSEFYNLVMIESGDIEEEYGGGEMQLYCQQGSVKSPKKKIKY